MKSQTKIKKRIGKKTSPELVETLDLIRRNEKWRVVAGSLLGSRQGYSSVNLKKLEKDGSQGDTIVVLGKVLGSGRLTKKLRVCALSFSDSAREGIKEAKGEVVLLKDEVKKNSKAEGVKVVR